MSAGVETPQILVLDDERSIRWVLEKALTQKGWTVHGARDVPEARAILSQHRIQLALVDIHLPGEDGISFTREVVSEFAPIAVIVMTGQSTMFHTIEAMKAGAFDYISKPFNLSEVEDLVQRGLNLVRTTARNGPAEQQSVRNEEELLVGNSLQMREVYKAIGRVAPTDLTALIQGESGTGKELIARSIHQHSSRARQPFVAINCAAIPSELLESELFGHEKGAFTGALERKRGKLELASKGTLFLDEIGDMPLKLQSKLLRVLQERSFERIGGHELITTDMRVIAATHRELSTLIEQGDFRSDLYYRLNVFPIHVAPLRERREDIPDLIEHFLRKGSREMAVSRKAAAPETMKALKSYVWPGNVRELENITKSLMITSVTEVIPVENLPQHLLVQHAPSEAPEDLEALFERRLIPVVRDYVERGGEQLMDLVSQQMERPLYRLLLEQTNWNQQRAARILGINRNTLRKRLELLGIHRDRNHGKA
jgi:two-component system nitrogen regulation response regulator GlnG